MVVATSTAACTTPFASHRSAAAFCRTYDQQKQQFEHKYDAIDQQADQDPDQFGGALTSLGAGIESIGDAVIIFDKLDEVAPDDIEPDVAAVRDSLKQFESGMGGSASDPLSSLASGLMLSMSSQGSWQRVGDYVTQHCGS